MEMQLSVSKAFKAKRVLITGTSGFVGKALLEKLLRCIPDLEEIHVLLRAGSHHRTAEERFWETIYPSSVFDRLKAVDQDAFASLCREKLRFVTAELTETRLGLSDSEFKTLAENTDLVINSAASVNFREPLDSALKINTLSLLPLAEFVRMAGAPLIQVSTCYVSGFQQGRIMETSVQPRKGERIPKDSEGDYDIPALIDRLQTAVEAVRQNGEGRDRLHSELIDLGVSQANRFGWNDTYTFTKWMGEQLLLKELRGHALTILRPSIIESALTDPVPGWIEGVKVADALVLAYARRRFSFFPARKKGIVDIIPVDLVVNSIILASAEALLDKPRHRIYQCGSSDSNPIRIKDYIRLITGELRQNWSSYPRLTRNKPPKERIRAVGPKEFKVAMRTLNALSEFKTFLADDSESDRVRRKSIDVTLKLATIYAFYTQPRYRFDTRNLQALAKRFEQDSAVFEVSASAIDWEDYISRVHLSGLERYGLSQAPE